MSKTLTTVPSSLGKLRKGLIEEGFTSEEAFQITIDLIRRCATPTELAD